jgi:4-hydroxy-4-methyl-2-oxoglutarate aldolase
MDIADRIVDKIKRNRISTTEVADCLDKSGVVPGVAALNRGHFRVGRVFWAYAYNESNWEVHEQIRRAGEGDIVLVETFDCGERAIFGELVAKFLVLYRQVAGIVVQGQLRDIPRLYKEDWPIWATGGNPVGCFNRENEVPLDQSIIDERKARFDGTVAVCDDSGVVVIPPEHISESFLDRLDQIEALEDIWFECIDRRKWDTFDTVCLKKYQES